MCTLNLQVKNVGKGKNSYIFRMVIWSSILKKYFYKNQNFQRVRIFAKCRFSKITLDSKEFTFKDVAPKLLKATKPTPTTAQHPLYW